MTFWLKLTGLRHCKSGTTLSDIVTKTARPALTYNKQFWQS